MLPIVQAFTNPSNRLCISPKGFTDTELGESWLRYTDEATKDRAAGAYRLIIFDGHSTHLSFEFIEYALDHNIILLCYPPHTTHALQGLDVVIFGRFKLDWVDERDKYSSVHSGTIGKHNFLRIFASAYPRTFTSSNILEAFKKTGIWPYDPSQITAQMLGPSKETSTQHDESFATERGVLARMTDFFGSIYEEEPPYITRCNRGQSTGTSRANTQTERSSITPARSPSPADTIPSTPTPSPPRTPRLHRILDGDNSQSTSDESWTPRSIRRVTRQLISSSSPLQHLASTAPFTDSTPTPLHPVLAQGAPLPEPDWSLARTPQGHSTQRSFAELVEENRRLSAQLLLAKAHHEHSQRVRDESNVAQFFQYEENMRLRRQLADAKEKGKRKSGPGALKNAPRVLTTRAHLELLRSAKEAKEAEERAKQQRKARRLAKQASVKRRDELWRKVKEDYERKKAEYAERLRRWEALPSGQRGRRPIAPKRSMKKKDIPLDIPEDPDDPDESTEPFEQFDSDVDMAEEDEEAPEDEDEE